MKGVKSLITFERTKWGQECEAIRFAHTASKMIVLKITKQAREHNAKKFLLAILIYCGTNMVERKDVVFMEIDKPTTNGRMYPKSEVQKALVDFQAKVNNRAAVGAFANDISGTTIDIAVVSHVITRIEIDGDYLVGDIQTLPTPKGAMLEAIIDEPDTAFGVRGYGQVSKNGVVSGFQMHSINVYFDPGALKYNPNKKKKSDPVSDYDRAMGIIKP